MAHGNRAARSLPEPPRLPSGRPSLSRWVKTLLAYGVHDFTVEEAHRVIGGPLKRVQVELSRAAAKGLVVRPAKGLYVVVGPEHQAVGAPPPLWYIAPLMRHLGLPYYVGLLGAAALQGASSQAPQELQVITSEARRVKVLGRGRIRWMTKRHVEAVAVDEMTMPTGIVRVSTAEATAVDLVHYARRAGYLDNVATILAELAGQLNTERLAEAARDEPATARRLGYLLGAVGQETLAGALRLRLDLPPTRGIPLDPAAPAAGAPIDPIWRVIINSTVAPD